VTIDVLNNQTQGIKKANYKSVLFVPYSILKLSIKSKVVSEECSSSILFATSSDYLSDRGRDGDLTHICISRGTEGQHNCAGRVSFLFKNYCIE
jgi:hypothetical protein